MRILQWIADKISYSVIRDCAFILVGMALMLLIIGIFHLPC